MWYFVGAIGGILVISLVALLPFFLLLLAGEWAIRDFSPGRSLKYLLMTVKSLRRNMFRTSLTYLAIFVLVVVVTVIWSVLDFLDQVTAERTNDFKAVVTERWQIPSQMPFAYAASLEEGAAQKPDDVRPTDQMTWQFYGGTLDPEKMTRENVVFFFAMNTEKLPTMMDDLEKLDPQVVKELKQTKDGCILGRKKMQVLKKDVGDRFSLTSLNYKGIDLEFKIVGEFPPGRYDESAAMNREYLNDALDQYYRQKGTKHPLADKTLNLVWLRVADSESFRRLAGQIDNSPLYGSPAVKCETASSGISSFLEAYKDFLWGMRYLLVPAILFTMCLIVANAISIAVRERRTEMAVLKVLGYQPWQILTLILGEALFIGGLSGLFSAGITWAVIDLAMDGLKFPIAFFPAFFIPLRALWWGVAIGAATAFCGSIAPAWSARTVKVSEVFAKVA